MNEILNQKFGVEVEMYNITRAKAAQVVQQTLTALTGETWNVTLPGDHLDERKIFPMSGGRLSDRGWKIESDASIQARNVYERTELVSPVLTWAQMPLLQQIIRDLRKAGAKSDPAHHCGVHVHVDGAGHTARTLLNLTNIMASHEQLLIGAIGVDRLRVALWCGTVDANFLRQVNARQPKTLDQLKQIWYASQSAVRPGHYNETRYHMLNLHSFFEGKGVEFRLFQFDNFDATRPVGRKGGLHAGQLKAYVQLCLAMNYRALHTRAAKYQPLQSSNQRYTMRCWLLRLGFIGDEFATARRVFTNRLPGDTAWRYGRPPKAAVEAVA